MRRYFECTEPPLLRRLMVLGVLMAAFFTSPISAQSSGERGLMPLAGAPIVPPFEEKETRETGCQSEACKRLKLQIQRGCRKAEDVPYADTIFLRRGVDLTLLPEERRTLSLARLAQAPDVAENLLAGLLLSEIADIRYAAALHLVLSVQSTQGNLAHPAAERGLKLMEADAGNISYPASDYFVLAATRENAKGNARRAMALLEQAVDVDRRSYPALLALLTQQMDKARRQQSQGGTLCRTAFEDVFRTLGLLMDLEPCRSQAAHTGVFLARDLIRPDRDAPYLAALAYLSTLSSRPVATRQVLENLAAVPRMQCRAFLIGQIEEFAGLSEQ